MSEPVTGSQDSSEVLLQVHDVVNKWYAQWYSGGTDNPDRVLAAIHSILAAEDSDGD